MDNERDEPLDEETVAGIINLLMRIDARLEMLIELVFDEEDENDNDT